MIVTVLAMRMVQLAAYEVIDMVTMRYGFVPAVWTVLMRATGFRGAPHGIFGADRNHMFVDVILMHVVKMAVVKIVHMAIMANRGVSAVWAVLMGVVGMVLLGAGGHDTVSFISNLNRIVRQGFSAACSIALCTNRRTWVSLSA
jgi:hypothetical protein